MAKKQESAKAAFEDLIDELRKDYLPWYEEKSASASQLFRTANTMTLALGLGTTIFIALKEATGGIPASFWTTAIAIILPALASFTAVLPGRLLDRKNLREGGKLRLIAILWKGKVLAAEAADSDQPDYASALRKIIKDLTALENDQLAGIMNVLRSPATQS